MEHLSEPVLAALIGAFATVATATLQLFRSQSQPESRTKRRKSWTYTLLLMLACFVGGFAVAEFLGRRSEGHYEAMSLKLQAQLAQISQETVRAAQAQTVAPKPDASMKLIPVSMNETLASAAAVEFPGCQGPIVGFATQPTPCSDQNAVRIAVCVLVPATAKVNAVETYARFDDTQPWSSVQMASGEVVLDGRFEGDSFERPDVGGAKQVCIRFAHWNAQPRTARILARYDNKPPSITHAAVAPNS